jgi:hypothetical protein
MSSVIEGTPAVARLASRGQSELTEVHVPGPPSLVKKRPKWAILAGFSRIEAVVAGTIVKSKYQSKWCGNRLALTIYVNANELRFLSH